MSGRPPRPRAVAYLRVSTAGQIDGYGLDVQEQQVRECCEHAGFRLVEVMRDEGVSGGLDAEDRPGLAEALNMLQADEADVLVVAKLDRLARTLTVQEAALAHVWRHGKRVWACDLGEVLEDDPDDPMRTAMRQMSGVFAQLERGMIRARMRAGKARKAEEGGYVGGAPPYGYRADGGELVEDPREQDALRLMRRMRRKRESLRAIAEALTEAGYPTKRGADSWHPMAVSRILKADRRR